MTLDQRAVALLTEAALLAIGTGLLVRRRWRLSWFFSAYVLAAFTGNVLVTWWSPLFFVPGFWMAKQAVYDALKIGLAVELAWRTFRAFPGARAAARQMTAAVLAVTTVAAMAVSGSGLNYLGAFGDLHPRVVNGTVWLLAATFVVAQWYRVPIHPFHSAVLASYGAYLALFGVLLSLVGLYGWAALPYFNALDPPAYLLATLYWAVIAWRTESAVALAHAETLRKVELRTASCG